MACRAMNVRGNRATNGQAAAPEQEPQPPPPAQAQAEPPSMVSRPRRAQCSSIPANTPASMSSRRLNSDKVIGPPAASTVCST